MSRQAGVRTFLFCAAVGVIAVTAGSYFVFGGSAQVSGTTVADRVTSINRIADEQPSGAADALADAALKESDWRAREAALAGLSHMAQPRHRPAIEQATNDPVPQVRAAAAAALGSFADNSAADRLGELAISDPETQARIGAVMGLGRTGSPQAYLHLLEAMERSTPEVQYRALREMYRKLNMKYVGPTPDKEPDWPAQIAFLCELVKKYPEVQEAYKSAGKTLVRRPELQRAHPRPQPANAGSSP